MKFDLANFETEIIQKLKTEMQSYKSVFRNFFNTDADFSSSFRIKLKDGKINYETIIKGEVRFFYCEIRYFKPPQSSIIYLNLIEKKEIHTADLNPDNIEYTLSIIAKDLIQFNIIMLSNVRNATHLFPKSLKYRTDIVAKKKIHDAYENIEVDQLTRGVEYSYQSAY